MKDNIIYKIKTIFKKRGIIIAICAILTALSVFGINKMNANSKDLVEVLRTTRDIEKDVEINIDMFKKVKVEAVKGVNYATEDDLKDAKINTKLYEGEDLIVNKINKVDEMEKKEIYLYSLKLTPEAAVAGRIREGDKILIAGSIVNGVNTISDYVLKDTNGTPKEVKVRKVYNEDNSEISDTSTAAWQFTLELDNKDDIINLDKAVNTQTIKLVMPVE